MNNKRSRTYAVTSRTSTGDLFDRQFVCVYDIFDVHTCTRDKLNKYLLYGTNVILKWCSRETEIKINHKNKKYFRFQL